MAIIRVYNGHYTVLVQKHVIIRRKKTHFDVSRTLPLGQNNLKPGGSRGARRAPVVSDAALAASQPPAGSSMESSVQLRHCVNPCDFDI